MIASQGILTSAGGTNSHAAVVARGEGIPAVCGADAIKLDLAAETFTANGTTVQEGEVVTIDGFTGNVYVGELPLEESVLEKARSGDAAAREEKIWKAFERLMAIADARRRLRVRANADTPDQSSNARERGAEGIGLCRTEHMFLGEERVGAVRQMIFAETEAEEQAAYDALLPLQREDFVGIFRRWTACRSRSGCSTRRCTSSSRTRSSSPSAWPGEERGEDEVRCATSGCRSTRHG